eukprot:SM003189S12257  [mRNA]  locus=s3189:2:1472:- [translate_table: standard]
MLATTGDSQGASSGGTSKSLHRGRHGGWSHHPVSARRYHVVLPLEEDEGGAIGKGRRVCPNCALVLGPTLKRCQDCGAEAVRSSMLDCRTHLLHGVLHANGFGHLLRVNGRERGSPHATGRDLMSLWDRVCSMLRARRVSVMDVSKKLSLDLRLLHSAAHGMPWYGRWGYVFGHGSFGIQPAEYAAAVEAVRSAPLSQLVSHFMGSDHELLGIVALYQRLAKQAGSLATFGDLMRFMLELLQRPSPPPPPLLPAAPPSPVPLLAAAAAQGSPSNSHHRRSAPASPSFPPSPVMLGGPYHTLHSAGGSFGSGSHLSGSAAVAAMGSPKVLTPNRWQTASGGGLGGGGGGSGSA